MAQRVAYAVPGALSCTGIDLILNNVSTAASLTVDAAGNLYLNGSQIIPTTGYPDIVDTNGVSVEISVPVLIDDEITSYDGLTGDPESIKIPYIVYDNDLQAQNGTVPTLLTYTPTTIATLYITLYVDVTAHVGGTITAHVTYTTPNNTSRTTTYPFTDGTGSNTTAPSAVGDYHGKMLPVRVKANSAVTVDVTATGGYNGTFDVGGQIIQADKV